MKSGFPGRFTRLFLCCLAAIPVPALGAQQLQTVHPISRISGITSRAATAAEAHSSPSPEPVPAVRPPAPLILGALGFVVGSFHKGPGATRAQIHRDAIIGAGLGVSVGLLYDYMKAHHPGCRHRCRAPVDPATIAEEQ